MAQMDARIILAGQQPNFLNTLATANQAAAQQKGFQRTDQMNAFLQENGAGIVRGDQNALAGYGQFDPKAAVGIQATQQGMRINEEELKLRRQQAAQQAEVHVAKMSSVERAQEAEKTKQGLMAAGRAFDAGNEAEFNRILQQNGVEPFPMSEFPYRAAEYAGVLDALEKANQYGKPPAPAWEVKDGVYYDKNNPGAGAKPVQGMAPGTDSAAEQKIARLMEGGIDRDTAVAIADGRYKVGRDPITGQVQIVDAATGNLVGGQPQQAPQPTTPQQGTPPQGATSTMPEGVDFNQATGFSGFIANLGNTLTDAAGMGLISPNNEKATQAMQNLSTNTMITLADGVAGRPSNFLLEKFEGLSSQPNSIFQGEGRTRERLKQTRAMIAAGIQLNQDVIESGVTPQMQAEARQNIARLSRLVADYDAVIEGFGKTDESAAASWMVDTDPATWTEEQKIEAEKAWGLK